MKLGIFLVFISIVLMATLVVGEFEYGPHSPPPQLGDSLDVSKACYICDNGTYVLFTTPDTLNKRKRAKEELECSVVGTAPVCKTDKILD